MARSTILMAICATVASTYAQGSGGTDLLDLANRVRNLQDTILPVVTANATMAVHTRATAASMDAVQSTSARIATMLSTATELQNTLSGQVSSAVRVALQSQMNEFSTMVASKRQMLRGELSSLVTPAVSTIQSAATGLVSSNPNGLLVGFTECAKRENNPADENSVTFMTCFYTKKQANTVLKVSISTNGRQIYGRSYFRFYVDDLVCKGPANQDQSDLRTGFHGSGDADLHYPYYVGGFCFKTSNNQPLGVGRHKVEWRQTSVSSDSYIGWETSSRLRIEEWAADSGSYQTV